MRTAVQTGAAATATSQTTSPRRADGRPRRIAAAAVLLVLLAGVAAALVRGARPETDPAAPVPRGATGPGGGIAVNTAAAGAPTLDVYLDFQCPACRAAHDRLRAALGQLEASGRIRTVVHLTSGIEKRLYGQAGTSSSRAAAAAACAADAGRLAAYQDAVFARQPTDEGTGFSDEDLRSAAAAAGLAGERLSAWSACVGSARYAAYVDGVDDARAREGVNVTPAYRVDGRILDVAALVRADRRHQQLMLLGAGQG